jgi:hypothetical protein
VGSGMEVVSHFGRSVPLWERQSSPRAKCPTALPLSELIVPKRLAPAHSLVRESGSHGRLT